MEYSFMQKQKEKPSDKRPNILLICTDQWRGDCLSISGHHTVQTPYLDQLALGGVRFASAYSECPTCIAARASLMTGCTPRTTGRVGYRDGVPWDYPVTLAGEFSRHGYHTQAIGKMHVFPEREKLGFDEVILHDGHLPFARRHAEKIEDIDDYIPWLREQTGRQDADYFEHGVTCNSYIARPWDKEEYLHPTNFVTSKTVDYLRQRQWQDQPFFLFVSYHRPHPPYDPPAWAFEQYLHEQMPPPPIGDWAEFLLKYEDRSCEPFVQNVSPKILQRARAGYFGHMTHIDHQLSRIVESLNEFQLENTYILFVSDHGEMIGDHHLFRKGFPYQGSANIPFILKGPIL
jgi:arylsulfatase A-like enzyme